MNDLPLSVPLILKKRRLKQHPVKPVTWVILGLIILLGSFLRFYKIDKESLWFDELATWEFSRYDIRLLKSQSSSYSFNKLPVYPVPERLAEKARNIIRNTEQDRIHLPFYYLIISLIKDYRGDSEFHLRFLSALFGTASILMIFFLARQFVRTDTALFAAFLLAILWLPVHQSREARMYPMILFFCMLLVYLMIRINRRIKKEIPVPVLSYGLLTLTSVLLTLLHFFGFFITGLVWIYEAVFLIRLAHSGKTAWKTLIIPGICGLLILAASLPVAFKVFFISSVSRGIPNIQWIPKPDLKGFFLWFNSFFNYPADLKINYVKAEFYKSPILRDLILILIAPALFFTLQTLFSRKNKIPALIKSMDPDRKSAALLYWILVPAVIAFVISLIYIPIYVDRYLIFMMPPVLIVSADLILRTFRHRFKWIVIAFTVLIALSDLVFVKEYYTTPNGVQYNEAARALSQSVLQYPGSWIAADVGSFGLEYYLRRWNLTGIPVIPLQWVLSDDPQLQPAAKLELDSLKQSIAGGKVRYLWYFSLFTNDENSYLKAHYQKVEKKDFFRASVTLYDLQNQAGQSADQITE